MPEYEVILISWAFNTFIFAFLLTLVNMNQNLHGPLLTGCTGKHFVLFKNLFV